MTKELGYPIFPSSWRNMRAQTEWKVPSAGEEPKLHQFSQACRPKLREAEPRPGFSPKSRAARFRSSPAALFVNVTAKIWRGAAFLSDTRCAIRCVNVLVLPDPAPAR